MIYLPQASSETCPFCCCVFVPDGHVMQEPEFVPEL